MKLYGTGSVAGQFINQGSLALPGYASAVRASQGFYFPDTANTSFVNASTPIASLNTSGITANSSYGIGWSSTSDVTLAKDTALSRLASGVVAIGTGSSGNAQGTLIASSSSFTNATSSTSFFSALGRFTDSIISGTLRLIGSANPTVNEAGELAYNTTSQSLSFATTTSGGGELPFYPPVSVVVASSSWTGTSTEVSWVTLPNYSETILTGICYANAGAKLVVGNGTASTSVLSLSSGTSSVSVNQKFNNGGTRVIFAIGSVTAGNTIASCKFERLYAR